MVPLKQQPMANEKYSIPFWKQVAAQFKDVDGVIFDLFNEPYPNNNAHGEDYEAWRCWLEGGNCVGVDYRAAGMQSLLDAVRSTGASNLVILSGIGYASELMGFLTWRPKDIANNYVAAIHQYNFAYCSAKACWESSYKPTANVLPVIAGEFGEDTGTSNFVSPLLRWYRANGIHFLAWAWSVGSHPSVITSYDGVCTAGYGCGVKAIYASLAYETPSLITSLFMADVVTSVGSLSSLGAMTLTILTCPLLSLTSPLLSTTNHTFSSHNLIMIHSHQISPWGRKLMFYLRLP